VVKEIGKLIGGIRIRDWIATKISMPNNNTKFQWSGLITFSVVLLLEWMNEWQTGNTNHITSLAGVIIEIGLFLMALLKDEREVFLRHSAANEFIYLWWALVH